MKKVFNKKVLIVLVVIGIICITFATAAFAAEPVNTDIWGQGKKFIDSGNATMNFNTVWQDIKPIARIVMGIGLVVLVCVGSVLGVKYMTAGADDKAKVKQKLVWFCVAAALVVGATGIFNIVVEVASQMG
jgi:CDP-diglyceride synthetase